MAELNEYGFKGLHKKPKIQIMIRKTDISSYFNSTEVKGGYFSFSLINWLFGRYLRHWLRWASLRCGFFMAPEKGAIKRTKPFASLALITIIACFARGMKFRKLSGLSSPAFFMQEASHDSPAPKGHARLYPLNVIFILRFNACFLPL